MKRKVRTGGSWNDITVLWVALLFLAGPAGESQAAPKADLWVKWQAEGGNEEGVPDHSPWDDILGAYVVTDHPSGSTRFRYGDVSPQDRSRLKGYVDYLAGLRPTTLDRTRQLAYWINLYNALTVHVVLEHLPVRSIRDIDISPGLFSDGPWDAKLVEIEGENISLNDVEHRILRPVWKDPRIHYAVNCASIGCPDLQPEAYRAGNTEELLERGAQAYVNHPRGVRLEGERLRLSSIYKWFAEDFGGSTEGVLSHLQRHAEEPLRSRLTSYRGRFSYDYDWALNLP